MLIHLLETKNRFFLHQGKTGFFDLFHKRKLCYAEYFLQTRTPCSTQDWHVCQT